MKPQIIGEQEACYGYLTGLGVQDPWDPETATEHILYASFACAGKTQVWIVPDVLLFKTLTEFLYAMALHGDCQEMGGIYKLSIFKANNTWKVQPYHS
jgi:hypothetical protein